MQISSKKLPHSRWQYIAKLTAAEINNYYLKAAERLAKSVKIAGFRPGKAPLNLVRDQLNPDSLREEAYSLAVQGAWQEIIKELTLTPTAGAKSKAVSPKMPIHDPEVQVGEFKENQPTEIDFQFDVRPEIDVKGWEKIKVKKVEASEVTAADVDKVIDSLLKAHAKTVLKLTAAKVGDKVEVSFVGSLKGITLPKLSSKHFPLIIGEDTVIPGFADQLIGLKKGDQKKFSLPFPKDHFDKELANQSVDFELTVDEVYDVQLPEADDELAKRFGHQKLPELKAAINQDLINQRQEEFFSQQKASWLAEFEKCVETEVPQSLIEAEVERSRSSWQQFLTERHLKADDWLARQRTSLEEMEKAWRLAAASSVKIGLGLSKLATDQNKELKTNDDYHNFLDELVKSTISRTK